MSFEQNLPKMESPEWFSLKFSPSMAKNGRIAVLAKFRPKGWNTDVAVIVSKEEVERLNLPTSLKGRPAIWLLIEEAKPMRTAQGFVATKVREEWPSTFRATAPDGSWYFIDSNDGATKYQPIHGRVKVTEGVALPEAIVGFSTYSDRKHMSILDVFEPFSYLEGDRWASGETEEEGDLIRPLELVETQEKYIEGWLPTLYGTNVPALKFEKGALLSDEFFPGSKEYVMKGVWVKTPFGICTMPTFFQMWKMFTTLAVKAQAHFVEKEAEKAQR